MPALFRHIRTRMAVVFLLLLALVLGAVLLVVYRDSLAHAQAQVETEFSLAGKALVRLMDQRADRLEQGAKALAGASAFKQALRDADLTAVEAALSSHAGRSQAELAMLVSLDGRFLVNTRFPKAYGAPFPCMRMIQLAKETGGGSGFVRLQDKTYQVVLVPVMSPRPVAWLALGLSVDDATVADFQAQTAAGVNLLSVGDAGVRSLASSQKEPLRGETAVWFSGLSGADTFQDNARQRATLGGQAYETRFVKLDSDSTLDYIGAFTLPLGEAAAPYARLREALLVIAILATLVVLLAASLLAGRLTRPMQELTDALRRVGRGHYATRVTVKSKDELGALAEGFNRMAGEISVRERQINFLAYHDALTGLPNHAGFVKEINELLTAGKAGSGVMWVAFLGRLEAIDEGLGFSVANGLSMAVARRIQDHDDWRGGCLGKGRFAFFCTLEPGQERDEWEARVRAVLEMPVEWQGQRYNLDVHLGSALYPQDGGDGETLVRRAEQAMGQGLPTVGAHVAWQPEFEAGNARRLALLHDLPDAIEAGQLLACYQPKARLSDGHIMACELLLRWQHPLHGLLFPADFIAAAERSMLIRPLTRWVIDTAMAQAALWRQAGREMAVAVNLSARNLLDTEVVDQIAQALARHDLPPSALIVEIAEASLMDDTKTAMTVVNAITGLGVGLCIDDLGAAHSSLPLLSRLPVHELKIDKSLVLAMLESSQDAAIVKSSIDLAHALGLRVVAEGVETPRHWQRLLAYGCDGAQGYYLTTPMEAPAFEAWLAERGA
jgi:EAL domain-containing protein (putative c-di-GMP-specific phosphodiesterase class I)/GGDEF domain-containing protein